MFFSFLIAAAAAAVPVQLPAGEPASAWAEPLALAGLAPVASGAAPAAILTSDGARWTIRVVTPASSGRTVVVPAPTTVQAREDLAWLLASLLQPVGVRAQAPAPTLPRPVVPVQVAAPPPRPTAAPPPASPPVASSTPAAPAPLTGEPPAGPPTPASPPPAAPAESATVDSPPAATEVAAAPAVPPSESVPDAPVPVSNVAAPVAPDGAPPAATPVALAPPEPVPAAEARPSSRDRGLSVWVEPAAGLRLLSGVAASPDLGLSGGILAAGGWRLGAAGGWEQASTIVDLGEGRTVGGAWLGVEGGWSGSARLAPVVGGWLGGARRHYAEAGETVGNVFTPLAGGHAGGRLVVAAGMALALEGTLRCDLRPTDLYAPAVASTVASPCGGGARLGLEISAPEIGGGRRTASPSDDATASRRRSTNPARGSGHQEGA